MSLRSSLTGPDGSVHYTDSRATLDLVNDRGFVELPDVVRSLQLVADGKTLYASVPPDRAGLLPGVRWVRIDTASRAEARGASFGPIPDPTTVMTALAGATGKVRQMGRQSLDGQSFRIWRVAVSPREMASRVGPDGVASANQLGGLSLSWTADVWLGRDGLPRRIQLETPLTQQKKPAGKLMLDLRLGSFGDVAQIGVPPEDAVRRAGSMAEALSLVGAT
jgi:hypothetical protein